MGAEDTIRYIVGQEKSIGDILRDDDVLPLLSAVVAAGASHASVRGTADRILWAVDGVRETDPHICERAMRLEGETGGSVVIMGRREDARLWEAACVLLQTALDRALQNALKRMLTTETHAAVMDLSYSELQGKNERLRVSEARYRELAESLDRQVKERTEELKRAYALMLHREKLASVGQLAAGVAHEINNPLGFIISNLTTLERYTKRFQEMLSSYRSGADDRTTGARWADLKMDYILEDSTVLLSQTLEGARRAAKIVQDLRGFSHIDDGQATSIDVNEEIERTMTVLRPAIPADAKIEYDLQKVPRITAHAASVCQVLCNLVQNAVQSRPTGLALCIGSRTASGGVSVSIRDNGPGIPDGIKDRIFDPFFTTKEVGTGMGMGLTVVYEIMREHGGSVSVSGEPGKGACFTVTFPTTERAHG